MTKSEDLKTAQTSFLSSTINNEAFWHFLLTFLLMLIAFLIKSPAGTFHELGLLKLLLGIVFILSFATAFFQSLPTSAIFIIALLSVGLFLDILIIRVILVISLLVFIYRFHTVRKIDPKKILDALINSALAGSLILHVRGGNSFFAWQQLIKLKLGGDALFHASYASMLKTYQTPSTGLNGLVEIPYHFLSHAMFASFSKLVDLPVLEVYPLFMAFAVCPFLFITCAYAMNKINSISFTAAFRITAVVLWLVVLLPLDNFALWDSFFISESYTFALSLMFLGLSLIRFDSTLRYLQAGGLILLASFSKGSVGAFSICLFWGYWLFYIQRKDKLRAFFTLLVTSVLFVKITFGMVQMVSANSSLEMFSFISNYSSGGDLIHRWKSGESVSFVALICAVVLFFAMHFIVSWIALIGSFLALGREKFLRSDVVFLSIATLIMGIVSASLISIVGGAAYYFSNIAMFVSLLLLPACKMSFFARPRVIVALSFALFCFSILIMAKGWKKPTIHKLEFGSLEKEHSFDILKKARSLDSNPVGYFELTDSSIPTLAKSCIYQPFVFSAVTENFWIGVMETSLKTCPELRDAYANFIYFDAVESHMLKSPKIPSLFKPERFSFKM
jgi:hypothetical protein